MGAPKGQTHKTYSKEIKQEILEKLKTNQSHLSLAREYGISIKTIEGWQTKYRKGIDILNDDRLKNPNKSEKPTYEELEKQLDIVKKMMVFIKQQNIKEHY